MARLSRTRLRESLEKDVASFREHQDRAVQHGPGNVPLSLVSQMFGEAEEIERISRELGEETPRDVRFYLRTFRTEDEPEAQSICERASGWVEHCIRENVRNRGMEIWQSLARQRKVSRTAAVTGIEVESGQYASFDDMEQAMAWAERFQTATVFFRRYAPQFLRLIGRAGE